MRPFSLILQAPMSYWYEVFDNEQVQFATRKQAATITAVVAATVGLTVAGVALLSSATVHPVIMVVSLMTMWMLTINWTYRKFQHLRRVMWCVKISDRRIVGYDYTRRQTVLDWMQVQSVDLMDTGLVVTGPDNQSIEITHLFPDFAELSHRVVFYADIYDIPVFVDGLPWQNIDVYDVFPFLADAPYGQKGI